MCFVSMRDAVEDPVWCSLYTRKQLRVNLTQGEYTAAARDALPRILVHRMYNDLRGCQLEESLLLTSSRWAWNGMFSMYSWKRVLRNGEISLSFSCTKLSKTGVGEEVRVLAHVPQGYKVVQRLWNGVWQFLRMWTTELPRESLMPQLETCPRDSKT